MKSKVKIWAVLLSAAVMFGGCGKAEVVDKAEVNSLKKSIIASIDKHIERLDGQIASASEEFAAMRDSDKYPEEDMRALEEKLSALSKELSDIKDSASGLADLDADFTDAADKVNSALASLDSGLDTVRAMIAKLKQDAADTDGDDVVLCYVPKYDDRPDSLHYHLDGLKILGNITLKFFSQPLEAAESLAENWETELSALAIYDGNEYGLTITGVTATGGGLLSVSISADSLPRNFIEGQGVVGVKVLYGGKPVSSSVRLAAVVDESDLLTLLNKIDGDKDGQVIDDLNEMTELVLSQYSDLSHYWDLMLAEMPALTILNCHNCNLTTLDLSHNPALKTLYCSANSLTTLDLSNYTSLSKLSVDLTTKLIVSAGFSVGQAYSLVGQYVSVGGVTGVVCNINPVKIVSTDEISASWEDAKDWCTSKGPDWYLPTLDDFYFCWYYDPNRTLSSIGGVELDEKSYYWSSDYCDTGAYGIKCYSSQVYDTGTLLKVRAVRVL